MVTVSVDTELLEAALAATGLTSVNEVTEEALRTLLRLTRQGDLRKLRGIGWEGDLDDMRQDKPRPAT